MNGAITKREVKVYDLIPDQPEIEVWTSEGGEPFHC